MIKNKLRKLPVILTCVVIFAIVGVRIYAVNRRFPPVDVIEVAANEEFEINGIVITFKSQNILDAEDFSSDYSDPGNGDFGEQKLLVFDIDIKNSSDEAVNFPIYNFVAESKAWRNGIESVNAFTTANPDISIMQKINPGEKLSIRLPYSLYEVHFSAEEWSKIRTRKFSTVWLAYPIKIILKE